MLLWMCAKKHWGNLMLTLDQVKLLEDKVESLIVAVRSLYEERDVLRDALQKKDKEVEELKLKVASYETEQAKIEERVVNALNQLDVFQNSVSCAKAILSQANEVAEASRDSSGLVGSEEQVTKSPVSSCCNEKMETHISESSSQDVQTKQDTHDPVVESDSKQKEETEEDSDKQMDIF